MTAPGGTLDLIAKLLAKAERTDNAHEAEVFTAKAEDLMIRHGIERAQVEGHGVKKDEIVKVAVDVKGTYALADVWIAAAMASGLGTVLTFKSTLGNRGQRVWFVGFQRDVDEAQMLWESLVRQAHGQMKDWWRRERDNFYRLTANDQENQRLEYLRAFGTGAGTRLSELRTKIVAETSSALVLSKRIDEVKTHVADTMKIGKARSDIARGGVAAQRAGHRAGREAVSPKGVGA